MSGYTSAPWTAKGNVITKSDGYKIKQEKPRAAGPEAWEKINEQYEADARLIAASPELLEACELLLCFTESNGEPVNDFRFREAVVAVRQLVAKVRGDDL